MLMKNRELRSLIIVPLVLGRRARGSSFPCRSQLRVSRPFPTVLLGGADSTFQQPPTPRQKLKLESKRSDPNRVFSRSVETTVSCRNIRHGDDPWHRTSFFQVPELPTFKHLPKDITSSSILWIRCSIYVLSPSRWEEHNGEVHFTFWWLHKMDDFGCQQFNTSVR
jgi:hypothetical protein